MKRKFFSSINKCNSYCEYCFKTWNNYINYSHFSCKSINENDLIVYPCCDGNIFDDSFARLLSDMFAVKNRIFMSISTKNNISEKQMERLVEINNILKSHNGFLKISVSFSCLSMIDSIENGTLPYNERISLIKRIVDNKLTYVTIIKPILPFVQNEEYKYIIDETIKFSNKYIIGSLYVNQDTEFFEKYNLKQYPINEKEVSWILNNPRWLYLEDKEKTKYVCDYIHQINGNYYESDFDFFQDLINM